MINQISVPGWDSFKIGTFEEKLHHYDRDIGNKNSDESEPSNDLSFKKTLEEFPNIYKTSHEEKTKFKPEKKKPKKPSQSNLRKNLNNKSQMRIKQRRGMVGITQLDGLQVRHLRLLKNHKNKSIEKTN